ncbi:MAG: hypothetical protein PHH67_10550 [Methanosarcina sp.]|jgi:hypothetical protein|nr:hypothetical protein [Methanosarcina sp.]MDD3316579.1 hypothetical protein [Methanosarcina sp.]MDD4306925.1 hypothetical protein [Methanosarcina sp.]MDD4620196.1 hypothetical protein [Methanosarcina sp.]
MKITAEKIAAEKRVFIRVIILLQLPCNKNWPVKSNSGLFEAKTSSKNTIK